MKKPTIKELNSLDMRLAYDKITHPDAKYLLEPAGVEHYRLISHLARREAKKMVLDLGTFRGLSAAAVAMTGKMVVTVDIEHDTAFFDLPQPGITKVVTPHGTDWITDAFDFIILDTSHDGVFEKQCLNAIAERDWKGILLMDDTKQFKPLAEIVSQIPEAMDWTDIGHWSGTTIINYR